MEVIVAENKEQRGQGPRRHPGEPRGLRQRPGPHHPDHRARVRRLRQRSREVPRRPVAGERVHRVPPETGRLRAAPARRPDGPRQASLRRRHAGADGRLRRRRRALGAAEQGPHHDPPEHPDPPRAAARHGGAAEGDLRVRPLLARGLRQHGPQRDRRPLGRHRPRRDLRPDLPRDRLRPLLRPPPDDAADAAQDQDRLLRLRRGPGDHRHPRHRLPRPRTGRGQGLRGPGRRRHLDHGPRRADDLRVRRGRQRRLPESRRGRLPHLRPPGLAARQPRPGPDQGAGRQDRRRRLPRSARRGAAGRLGRGARIRPRAGRAPALRGRRGGARAEGAAERRLAERRPPGLRALRRLQRAARSARRASPPSR